jgi:hypothetical protein
MLEGVLYVDAGCDDDEVGGLVFPFIDYLVGG